MIVEAIVVSDTNIFLDLFSVDLLTEFFELPYAIHTSDFVLGEILQPAQQKAIKPFVKSKKLTVVSFEFSELSEISDLQNNCGTNLSVTDCSVWHHAKKMGALLLTGDSKLRKAAEKDNVLVSGIIYVFDKLVENGILKMQDAARKLSELVKQNPRLPHGECQKRIANWTS